MFRFQYFILIWLTKKFPQKESSFYLKEKGLNLFRKIVPKVSFFVGKAAKRYFSEFKVLMLKFATNSDFLISISLQPHVKDLGYFKLWILLDQII